MSAFKTTHAAFCVNLKLNIIYVLYEIRSLVDVLNLKNKRNWLIRMHFIVFRKQSLLWIASEMKERNVHRLPP